MTDHSDQQQQVLANLTSITMMQMAANKSSKALEYTLTPSGVVTSPGVVTTSPTSTLDPDGLGYGHQQEGLGGSVYQKQSSQDVVNTFQAIQNAEITSQSIFGQGDSFDSNQDGLQVYVTEEQQSPGSNVKLVISSSHSDLGVSPALYTSRNMDLSTHSPPEVSGKTSALSVPIITIQAGVDMETGGGHDVTMPCVICGDKGSGYHYSVFSCEGCKGFFKRTVQKNLQYSCKDDGSGGCNINKFTRNNCQYCRFQKCLQMGMKRDAVREDRSPGGKHRLKRKYEETGEGHTPLLNTIVEEQNINSRRAEKLVQELVDAEPDLAPRYDGNMGLQSMGINELMQFGYAELKYIIDWAKRLPEFNNLTIEDQMAMLKSSFMELNVLRLSYRSKDLNDSIKFADGFVVPSEVAKDMGWGKELISATLDFSKKLKEMELDATEFCILNGIVLTYPDAIGLKDKMVIHNLQTRMLDALSHYMTKAYPDQPRRYGKLLLRLPSLRTVSAKAAERFLSLTLDGSIQLNELVFEMIN